MASGTRQDALTAPLRIAVFRRIWLASLISNFGIMILGVGAAWTMSRLTNDAQMVALVQTALMLPIMILALPAGALSDMFDRRLVSIAALSISLTGAIGLCVITVAGLLTPTALLVSCFVVGSGMAVFSPAWQASVSEQVPSKALPSAIALNGISYNLARSVGPAIGGAIVGVFGAVIAFAANALFYIPLLIVLVFWKRSLEPARLAPETFWRAVISGLRFVRYSPSNRRFVVRTMVFGLLGGVVPALTPLITRDLLFGGASVYGLLLGGFGLGAVFGALIMPWMRRRFSTEHSSRNSAGAMGAAILAIAVSRNEFVTLFAFVVAGIAWTNVLTLYSVAIQMAAPCWVAGRALAIFQATIAGGIAVGAWVWGRCAEQIGVNECLKLAGGMMIASIMIGIWLRLPDLTVTPDDRSSDTVDPVVDLAITSRSGPIVIHIDYIVSAANARAFYGAMQDVRRHRLRMGAYGWSIARDIADGRCWTERFHVPTWNDYLHLVDRENGAVRDAIRDCHALLVPEEPVQVRRLLERPAGSVRWRAEAVDRLMDVGPLDRGAPI
ncbi:MFS transporter [Brevundimonas sp.]|uniref:MFS transporter n=1 Tax=Brevundimonas sp. TaxID=1871086 RepID=UPI00289D0E78|nr:MFS transporter [Brevundimonas sp.]